MHDDDEPLIDYEEQLRHALRRVPTPDSDPDAVLARVEFGVRRRVRRRRIGVASLSAAAVLAAAAVVVPSLDTSDSPVADPTHSPPESQRQPGHKAGSKPAEGKAKPGTIEAPGAKAKASAGKRTDPDDLSVSAIATNDAGAVSLIGRSKCPDGPCVVTGSPQGSSQYRIGPTGDRLLQPMNLTTAKSVTTEPGIQVGVDPSNSWAWTDAFYATHDAGRTWKHVKLPASLRVSDVESTGERVWAFGERKDGRAAVASSSEHSDDWVPEPVPVGPDEAIDTPMVVDGRVAFVASQRDGDRAHLVRQQGGGWNRTSIACPEPVTSAGTQDTVWLGCRNPKGSNYVTWTKDDGADWNVSVVQRPGLSAVGGVDSDTAVAAAGDDLYVVDSEGGTRKAATPYDESDDVWNGRAGYDSIRIGSDGTGYAATNGGALARTVDGGNTWRAESLP